MGHAIDREDAELWRRTRTDLGEERRPLRHVDVAVRSPDAAQERQARPACFGEVVSERPRQDDATMATQTMSPIADFGSGGRSQATRRLCAV
jgi:hypothetical protein